LPHINFHNVKTILSNVERPPKQGAQFAYSFFLSKCTSGTDTLALTPARSKRACR